MSLRILSLLFAATLGSVAPGAQAGTLSSATWTTELAGFGGATPSLVVPVIGTGTSTSSSVAVSLVLPAFQGGVFRTGPAINTYRSLTLSGSQALTATPGMASATMGVPGSIGVKVAAHLAKGVNASMLVPGKTTLVRIALNVGGTGSATNSFTVSGSGHYVTVDFYGWSPGMQTFTGLTSKFAPLPDEMVTGSFNLTAMGGGSVLLVSPTRITIDGALAQSRGVFFTTLQLQFVPEPGALLLLGAGGLALLSIARRRG
jgi:hypothetical protein